MASDHALIACIVKRSQSGKSIWTEIGRAYPCVECTGLTVLVGPLPPLADVVSQLHRNSVAPNNRPTQRPESWPMKASASL